MADTGHARQEIASMFPTESEVLTITDWWDKLLEERMKDGISDAEKGIFNIPYPSSNDAQDEDENFAYKRGWHGRRKELGDYFKWHD
jgi:hypothetical protein